MFEVRDSNFQLFILRKKIECLIFFEFQNVEKTPAIQFFKDCDQRINRLLRGIIKISLLAMKSLEGFTGFNRKSNRKPKRENRRTK